MKSRQLLICVRVVCIWSQSGASGLQGPSNLLLSHFVELANEASVLLAYDQVTSWICASEVVMYVGLDR